MKRKVLVFDTEVGELSKIQVDLLLNDYDVEVTNTPAELSSRIERYKPDLVILNSNMLAEDCRELCEKIRTEYKAPIISLGHNRSSNDCSTVAFIQKPVKKIELLGTISALMVSTNDPCCE